MKRVATPKAVPEEAPPQTQAEGKPLRLPLPKAYLNETEVLNLLGWSRRSLLSRPEGKRPPCIKLSPRKRIYDPEELAAWIHSLPRQK